MKFENYVYSRSICVFEVQRSNKKGNKHINRFANELCPLPFSLQILNSNDFELNNQICTNANLTNLNEAKDF